MAIWQFKIPYNYLSNIICKVECVTQRLQEITLLWEASC
jgi:hypothetical protein